MKNIFVGVICAAFAFVASAQPVQWRVQDGGNGHWYDTMVWPSLTRWDVAQEAAAAIGGYLATPTTASENNFVFSIANGRPAVWRIGRIVGPWIGLRTTLGCNRCFSWVSGEALGFTNWWSAPDNPCTNGAGVSYWEGTNQWQDHQCGYNGDFSGDGVRAAMIEWSADCNGDGIVDKGQILTGQLADLNSNGVPDICECTAPSITTQPIAQSVCSGAALSLSVTATGTSPQFQWRRNGTNISGATSATYTVLNAGAVNAGSYDCVISNSCGTVTSNAVSVTINSAPSITTQPVAVTPDLGQNISFITAASGASSFQWRKNGVNVVNNARISGAATASLNISSVGWADVGSYTCVATNSCGSTTSSSAALNIFTCNEVASNLGTQPFGNRITMRQAYSGVNNTTLAFGGTLDGSIILGDTWLLSAGTWTRVATTGPGVRTDASLCELGNGRVLLFGGQAVFQDIASSYGDTWEWNGTSWTRLSVTGPAPRSGASMVYDSVRNKAVLFGGLSITNTSLNDTWEWNGTAWTQVATTGPGARFGHAAAFDPVSGETVIYGGWDGWFDGETWAWNGTSWRLAATTGVVARHVSAMTFDENTGKILLFGGFEGGANVKNDSYHWTGSAWQPTGYSPIASPRWLHGMSFDRATRSVVITAGRTLEQAPLNDTVLFSSRPIPTSQPQDQTLVPGGAATFSVTTSRPDTVYQWKKDGVNVANDARISGATSATIVISNLQAADGGNYSCALTNACGSNSSASASLSCRPTVAQQPVGGSVKSGRSLQLVAQVVTTGSTTYRWKKDGVNLFNSDFYAGATSQSLTINAEDPTQSGLYTLTATNSCGTRTTNGVNVTVTCLADINSDGNVDGDDVIEFFASWDAGLAAGDVNQDGGTDSDDVIALFDRWDRGC